jgi:pimeloyl-ACP methyl ester carboxylesterase
VSHLAVAALVIAAILLASCRDSKPLAQDSMPMATTGGPARDVQIDAGGIALAGRLYGRTVTHALLLVPDAGRGIAAWEDVARELAATGLLVLAYDYPGHGASPPVSGSFRAEALVHAGIAFLKSRGAEKIALAGEGTGGAASLLAADADSVIAVAALSVDGATGTPGDAEAGVALAGLNIPVLLMGALGDPRQVAATVRLYEAARDPRTRALVPGTARGADLLRGADAGPARDVLRDFLREAFAPKSARVAAP